MIVIKYEEEKVDPITRLPTKILLGTESHQDIDEVLLPSNPVGGDPIFFTKKFIGNDEYRWEIIDINQHENAGIQTFSVTLRRKIQVNRKYYLKNILAAQSHNAAHVLVPWSIVEVEFGHSLSVGRSDGTIGSNKRYADTIQNLSMPKRRLAIVLQVHLGGNELIQVIPISSKQPHSSNKSMVEVTNCLSTMEHYQKPSWAVCNMIQTVTASRIMAPMTKFPHSSTGRDTRFRTQIKGAVRDSLKDAIMHGVAASGRVAAATSLITALTQIENLKSQHELLAKQLTLLENQVVVYKKFAKHMEISFEQLAETYC